MSGTIVQNYKKTYELALKYLILYVKFNEHNLLSFNFNRLCLLVFRIRDLKIWRRWLHWFGPLHTDHAHRLWLLFFKPFLIVNNYNLNWISHFWAPKNKVIFDTKQCIIYKLKFSNLYKLNIKWKSGTPINKIYIYIYSIWNTLKNILLINLDSITDPYHMRIKRGGRGTY